MTQEIHVYRKIYTQQSTIGELWMNGSFFCYTLEDTCRDANHDGKLLGPGEVKVQGQTAIPSGRYQVIIDYSERFGRLMPHILGVPGFSGIRIHNGNTAKDTDGCILQGNTREKDFIGNSVKTFDKFFPVLKTLLSRYQVYITVHDTLPEIMINNLKISAAGISLLKRFESLRLRSYVDLAGVRTIGYGSTYYKNGTRIRPGDTLKDEAAANDLFSYTLQVYEQAVNQLVRVVLNQNEFDALVSFAYNVGTNALANSTLLKLLNAGDCAGAAAQFAAWNKITDPATAKKIVDPNLTARRTLEAELFNQPVN